MHNSTAKNMLVSVYLQNACNNIEILSIYIAIMMIMNMNKKCVQCTLFIPHFYSFYATTEHNVIESDKTY